MKKKIRFKTNLKKKGDITFTKVKIMFRHPMISEDIARRSGYKPNYITNIVVRYEGDIVYNASVGMMLSINPYVKFGFLGGAKGGELEVTVTDNNKNIEIFKGKIK